MLLASLGDDLSSFFDAVGSFFGELADIRFGSLLIALAAFGLYLARAPEPRFNILRAAYPDERIPLAPGLGRVHRRLRVQQRGPARGGDVMRLFLTQSAVPGSSYPAVASSFLVELDLRCGRWASSSCSTPSPGVFPKPPDFSKLTAFDLSFFASHPRFRCS